MLISALPLIITASGLFLLVKLKFFFIRHPIKAAKHALGDGGAKKSLCSLFLALAGTLGVGNIVGVAAGIYTGGVGSVFWLLVSSLFSSALKYCEVALCTNMPNSKFATAALIKHSFKRFGKYLAPLYAALCLGLSLTMGTALQTGAIYDSSKIIFDLDPIYLLIPLMIIIAIFVIGKNRDISRAISVIIPLTTGGYIILCASVIIPRINMLAHVSLEILSAAFDPRAIGGGISAFLIKTGMRDGYSRGILSNEAGAGTSAFAHMSSNGRTAAQAGIYGVIEVIFDTVILCPLTAAAILVCTDDFAPGGATLVSRVFNSALGEAGSISLFIFIFAFALSTVLCWYYYGRLCSEYLFGNHGKILYFPLFFTACASGFFLSASKLIAISDVFLFLMTLICCAALIKNADKVKALSANEGLLN